MRPRERQETGEHHLFRSRLDQIIDLSHALVKLSRAIDWRFLRTQGLFPAPEVECIGKGKAHRPYEFGVKVSVATSARRSKGGQFVTHVAALPGNPYDGHTLATVIPAMEDMIGYTSSACSPTSATAATMRRPIINSGSICQASRGRTPPSKPQLRRRAPIEAVIGHLKAEHRMACNYLAHRTGDALNALLAAAGYNFHLLLKWLQLLLSRFLAARKTLAALQWVRKSKTSRTIVSDLAVEAKTRAQGFSKALSAGA